VVNYSDENVPFTRVLEFRHFHPERNYQKEKTVIVREFSRFATTMDEPYYPVNTPSNIKIYKAYEKLATTKPSIIFGGRLGTYKYIDMHQAIGAALKLYLTNVRPLLTGEPIPRGSHSLADDYQPC
jgi:UDP-galactopyranose mutase